MKKDLIITDIGYEKAIINAIRDVQIDYTKTLQITYEFSRFTK